MLEHPDLHLQTRTAPTGSIKNQLITGCFFGVTQVETIADQHRMIPGLSCQRLDLPQLNVFVWIRFQQAQVPRSPK
jgi:hypothetical protein